MPGRRVYQLGELSLKCCIMLGVDQILKRAACAGLRRHCLELFFYYCSIGRRDPQRMVQASVSGSFWQTMLISYPAPTPQSVTLVDPCGHPFLCPCQLMAQ